MNLRGERVLIFGDSLSARSGPEQYNVTEGANRTASAPGERSVARPAAWSVSGPTSQR